ncbi:MAG TPA: MATE family efflux transporter [Woeseiaceae bacterium]|nr:MATE family efflux transporter [Woeseiaceae bacterium]
MAARKGKLTEGAVGQHLVKMTLPMLVGISTMMAQGLIDAWFLGMVGDRALAAFSFGFPILMIITSVAIGLSAGTSSVVARAIGTGTERRARRLATDSLVLAFLVTAILAAIGLLTIEPLFLLLGAPVDMIPMIRSFMTLLYSGIPFLVVGMVGMSCMRATGDTMLPGKLMIAAALLNVVLDPIFIFGLGPVPAMALDGAAVAALLARGMMFVGTVYILVYRLQMVSFKKPKPGELSKSWIDILHVGLPAAGTNAIIPIAVAFITAMIARYGPEAVAGFGVASRIESMVLVIFYALSSVIGPFVGQNLSAGKKDRIKLSLRQCAIFCLGSGLVLAILLAMLSGFLPGLFSDNPEVNRVTRLFLWIAPLSYGAYGIVMVVNAAFNGLGKPMPAVYISVARMIVLYLPVAFILQRFFGIAGIFAAYALANLVTGLLGYVWAQHTTDNLLSVDNVHADPATGHE